jgi:hypothetical protein
MAVCVRACQVYASGRQNQRWQNACLEVCQGQAVQNLEVNDNP